LTASSPEAMKGIMNSEKARTGYHHGDLRSALVDGARSLVEESGVEALSLREVARRAGVSRAAPYHHFKNKEAMLAAVARDGFERLAASMDVEENDGMAELEGCGRAYLAFALDNRMLYRLMFGTKVGNFEAHPELHDSAKCAFQLLVDRLARVCPDEPDLVGRAMAVWGAVHGLALLLIDNQGPFDAEDPANRDRWIEATLDLIRRSLRAG